MTPTPPLTPPSVSETDPRQVAYAAGRRVHDAGELARNTERFEQAKREMKNGQ